jgi:hypothetical protein
MKPRKIPRGTFLLGGSVGGALGIALQVLGIFGLTQVLRWGPLEAGIDRILSISLIFAGFPTFLAAGGVARLVSHRLAEKPAGGLGRAVLRGALAMAAAGMGLALLCAVPLDALPEKPQHWAPMFGVGALAGAVTGAAIGVLVAMRQRRHAARTAILEENA